MMGENMPLSAADVAAVTRNNDSGMFGGFGDGGWLAYIIIFVLIFGWGGNGNGIFGGNRGGGEAVTEAGLCNAMNFNNLENAVGRLGDTQVNQFTQLTNGICNLGYETLRNFNTVTSQIAQCCCETQRQIDQVNYNGAMNTAAIQQNTTEWGQKILDKMCQNEIAALQQKVNSMELQAALANVVRYPQGFVYTAGGSPFCGNGCCGNFGNI